MVGWLGLREAFVPFERPARVAGESKYPFWKMIRFSWTAITSFSAMPLRMTLALGLVAVGFAFCYLVYALTVALVFEIRRFRLDFAGISSMPVFWSHSDLRGSHGRVRG